MSEDTTNGARGRTHSKEYAEARRKRSAGISDAELREAVAGLGAQRVRKVIGTTRSGFARLVAAAERSAGAERAAWITVAGSEPPRVRATLGATRGAPSTGSRTAARGAQARAEGSSECYWVARSRRRRGIERAELTSAVSVLENEHVGELMQAPTFSGLVKHAEQCSDPARRRAYLTLAAAEFNAVREAIGIPVDMERERRSCEAWARKIGRSAEGVSTARIRGAVKRLGPELVATVLDGAEPLFAAATRRAAAATERSAKRCWVRVAVADPERLRSIVREEGRTARAQQNELCASVPEGMPPASPEVRVVTGGRRQVVALSAIGPLVAGALGLG